MNSEFAKMEKERFRRANLGESQRKASISLKNSNFEIAGSSAKHLSKRELLVFESV